MKYHYVYLTTNLLTGCQYVGSRSTDNIESDPYMGSNSRLKFDIKYFGIENFKKEILEVFQTRLDAFAAEYAYIEKHKTLEPNGYNISPTGGHAVPGMHSDKTKKTISSKMSGRPLSEFHKKNLSKAHKGYVMPESEKEKRRGHSGWHQTEEVKKRISEAQKNRVRGSLTEEHKKKIGESLKGTVFSEERKRNISLAKTGVPCPQGQRVKISQTLKGRKAPLYTCPKCGKTGGKGAMLAFHKCKIA